MRELEVFVEKLKHAFKNKWVRSGCFITIGALCGFAYYYFIGCTSGTCPLTSNPYVSSGYGAVVGLVVSPQKR